MCWKCSNPLDFSQSIYRNSTCSFCGADLHCCRGCKFYSPGSHFDCHETIDEICADKERANFCDHFQAGTNPYYANQQSAQKQQSAREKARGAFDALFS